MSNQSQSATQPSVSQRELAVFDLDHTLIDADSDYLWGEYLVKNRLVDEANFRARNQRFYEQYVEGTLDSTEYGEFVAGFLAQHDMPTLQAWRDDYVENTIAPHVRPKAQHAMQMHIDAGHDVLIISATNDFIVQAVAALFLDDATRIIATPFAIENDRYTGRLAGRPSFQDGKLFYLEQWLANQQAQGVTYSKTYAYSDSKNDIPLLSWADVAVVVSPDDALHAYALAHQWAIEDWLI